MADQPWFDIQRDAFATLQRAAKARADAERDMAEAYRTAIGEAEREVEKARRMIAASRKKAVDECEAAKIAESADTESRVAAQTNEMEAAFNEARAKAEQQYRIAEARLRNEYNDRLWTIDSMHEASVKEADDEKLKFKRFAIGASERIEELWNAVGTEFGPFHLTRGDALPTKETDLQLQKGYRHEAMMAELENAIGKAELAAERFGHRALPWLVGFWGTVWCVFVAGGLSTSTAALMGVRLPTMQMIGLGGAVIGGLIIRQILWIFARRQVRDRGKSVADALTRSALIVNRFERHTQTRHDDRIATADRQQTIGRKQCDDSFLPRIATVAKQGKEVLARMENERSTKLGIVAASKTKADREARIFFAQKIRELTETHDEQLTIAENRYTARREEATEQLRLTRERVKEAWFAAIESVQKSMSALQACVNESFAEWDSFAVGNTPLITRVPLGIPFGTYDVDLHALPDGVSEDAEFASGDGWPMSVPAVLPFPDRAAVLFPARDAGRDQTVQALQTIVLRFLTGLPPGKVRLTIIDPVGLGENFAAFMHLADYDDLAITSRIWTEPQQIEARLADLTEHMETVIQKYLRNQYRSIEEYNRAAGEVAEPYRVLVVANFPTNFTPEAARRLVAIMKSGPACGVCSLIGLDVAAPLPRDFRLADLEQEAFRVVCKNGQFTPSDQTIAAFPLTVDSPPPPQTIAAIVRRVGEAGRLTKRVEVPFDHVAPAADRMWASNSTRGFEVPVGRTGATRKRLFALGQGTSQHALIAGKTGSGKSTLLHALITNLAMYYSPDEAELYLIDFKKGVEFKMYAELGLPHARVVAIESEREFGISVLQRLDGILRERGEQYRSVGANDVATYREARPDERFPRILLVVDEFQEFFVEDDKLAQEASLLLDRLVRQGRAFGVHILLGSQTLGGAYSLARSTIDQMAVRVALQCSEADAQLILSKDNSAARLLSRPGDAIYNDANGQIQGNDPFQVVWLSDDRRAEIVSELHQRAQGMSLPPPIVFEGNARAELATCPCIRNIIKSPPPETAPATVWLGDAVAIKEPTSVIFRPQAGSNLLLLGQQEEAALGIQAAAITALSARFHSADRIAIIDGTPADAETADVLHRVTAALNIPSSVVERYQLPSLLADWAAEVERRQKGESTDRRPRFLFVHGLQRLRELRKPEDDFGYGRRGEKTVGPGEHFLSVLRNGPAVGIHTVLWCDSLTNLTRSLDRQVLREFSLRVLFQMSTADSSQLTDTPAASRLGPGRALFLEEGQERPEKFRPYSVPASEVLTELIRD